MAIVFPQVLRAVRLKNLRSLVDTGYIELKPLMLLVGPNGSGKSTFLRFFPLLRQSAESRTRGPVLWFQDGSVDFGGFKDAVRRGTSEITFGFQYETYQPEPTGIPGCEIDLQGADEQTNVSTLRLSNPGHAGPMQIRYGADGQLHLSSGGGPELDATERIGSVVANQDGLIPGFVVNNRYLGQTDEVTDQLFSGPLRVELERLAEGTVAAAQLATIMDHILSGHGLKQTLQEKGGVHSAIWHNNVRQMFETEPARLDRLTLLAKIGRLPGQTSWASRRLASFARSIAYMGPFRASPERFYRFQELAIDLLDPRGSNLAMVLHALPQARRDALHAWLMERMGFGVSALADAGHVRLQVQLPQGTFNFVDVGFGYSQMLPFLVQLWLMHNPDRSQHRAPSPAALFAVEQPELHLHPRQQTLIGRALALLAREHGPRVLVETHSQAIIAEVGMQVALGKLDPQNVSVLCFEQDAQGDTSVRTATFREDGSLDNWPIGFFSATP